MPLWKSEWVDLASDRGQWRSEPVGYEVSEIARSEHARRMYRREFGNCVWVEQRSATYCVGSLTIWQAGEAVR
jgi:hypothetical protein